MSNDATADNSNADKAGSDESGSDRLSEDALQALKIAFTYMPLPIEVNRFDHGENFEKILADIQTVREILLINDVDPDEVADEINPDEAPNSSY